MRKIFKKQYFPLLFLISISSFWAYYYTHDIWFNDYGSDKRELWLLIDCFITVPLICFYCFWDDKKTASIKAIMHMSLLVLLGSYVIPQVEKYAWLYLENIRYVIIVIFVLFEFVTAFTVILSMVGALKQNQDPDDSIASTIEKYFGQSLIASIMQIEARVWTFLLFSRYINPKNFTGIKHFNSHLKDGVQSTLMGFIIITCVELPIVHTLLYFIWSPFAANVITGLTLISLVYFIAQYRAIEMRPVSFTHNSLIIRYSLGNPLEINLDQIKAVNFNSNYIPRNKTHKRYNIFGAPNIEIELTESSTYGFKNIYLGINNPNAFINHFKENSII